MRIAIVDVGYPDDGSALAACVLAGDWTDALPAAVITERIPSVAEYRPGAFYERELPAILAVLARVDPPPEIVVIDGYVWLDGAGRRGLGAHLHEAIGMPVVGVAKTAFAGAGHALPVRRGTSARPLYVTAAGIAPEQAALAVGTMHGPYRIPTLLGLADRATRSQAVSAL